MRKILVLITVTIAGLYTLKAQDPDIGWEARIGFYFNTLQGSFHLVPTREVDRTLSCTRHKTSWDYTTDLDAFLFNKPIYTSEVGSPCGQDFYLYASGVEAIKIATNGNVGIGTNIPHQKLHVVDGNILITGKSVNNRGNMQLQAMQSANGSLLFGSVASEDCKMGIWGIEYLNGQEGSYGLNFWKPSSACNTGLSGNYFLFLADNGNIGIGTNQPMERLSINGKICAKEVRVTLSGWPDFVFDKDYSLMSLQAIEQYIKTNQHLPDIPNATEVEENGIQLGEMNALLLKKIEELTLHLIDLQKQIDELKAEKQKGSE
ncbi:MAG: hypothetical protein LBL13_01005 [Bacteroidales bacterium]|jgi:hypothetical protein|nr:hypothetical protein [Bacteroidales bacterium]